MDDDPRRTSLQALKDVRNRTKRAEISVVKAERTIALSDRMAIQSFADLGLSRTLLRRAVFSL